MKILKLQESKEYCRYVDLTLLFQSRQKRFLNFTIRVHLVGFSHMTVGKKNENPTRKTRSKSFAILQVAEDKNSDGDFVNTKLLC